MYAVFLSIRYQSTFQDYLLVSFGFFVENVRRYLGCITIYKGKWRKVRLDASSQ